MSSSAYTPIQSPSARQPRIKHVSPPLLDANQVGRAVRTWLINRPGLACIAIGWAFAFAGIAASSGNLTSEEALAPIALLVFAVSLISFGAGCMFRDETDGKKAGADHVSD